MPVQHPPIQVDRPTPADLAGAEGWYRSGPHGEFVTTDRGPRGPIIVRKKDLTGHGNHLANLTGKDEPGYQVGLSIDASKGGPWSTPHPLMGIDRYGYNSDGDQHYANVMYLQQPIPFEGEFFFWHALLNTRGDGYRVYWGATTDIVGIAQGDNADVKLTIAGTQQTIATTMPRGPVLLEIARDASNVITCVANGVDITAGGLSAMPGTVWLDGFGWDGTGGDAMDDYDLEKGFCRDAVPSGSERTNLRSWINDFWALY